MRAARKDEPRFLAAGDDFDRVSERLLGLGQEFGGVLRYAQRLRADGADVCGRNPFQLFAEAPQGAQGALLAFGREGAVGVEPARKAHRLLPIALGDDPIAVDTADFHAKAVAAEVDGAK